MKTRPDSAISRARLVVLLAAIAILVPTIASAQLVSTDTRKCIDAINSSTRKVALTVSKETRKCTAAFAGGLLGSQTVAQCVAGSAKVQKMISYALLKADHACNGVPPAFGPPSIGAHPALAISAGANLLKDILGAVPETALSLNPGYSACQSMVLKLAEKCSDVRLNLFNKCKKEGLKRGFVTNATDLETVCLGTGATQPDPSGGKITKLCVTSPATQIQGRCVDLGIPLAQAFPGCAATTGAGLTECIDERIRCRVCTLLDTVDGLSRDCDLFDDGDDGNQSCAETTTCGDGVIDGAEACDDGNTTANDGCSATCTLEGGWTCSGQPTVCAPICGDGLIRGSEGCDDGGTTSGNGCSAVCQVEPGYSCTGAPSVCTTGCGDGLIRGSEGCDDGGLLPGDGCNAACQPESGWTCSGEPSTCHTTCGDGLIRGLEVCDDGNAASNDGCSATCTPETGWLCTGSPSHCTAICGDGILRGTEVCDDGNTAFNDGCGATCQIETGWTCPGGVCSPICGDGLRRGGEPCDDGDTSSGDGCDAGCLIETGWACAGQPSVCSTICGDGLIIGGETCDDGAVASGDGCNATCHLEAGWQCVGQPSDCVTICGDGLLKATEQCDDGNLTIGDGCAPTCLVEPGYICSGQPSVCTAFTVVIASPTHGIFSNASSVAVSGFITQLVPAQAFLTINGTQVPVAANRTFSTTVPLDATKIFNPIRATVTDLVHGTSANARVVVIRGQSIADGSLSPKSVGLRLTDDGLTEVEPLVSSLAGNGLNLAQLLPVGTVVVDDKCLIDSFAGCLGHGTVTIKNPPPSYSTFALNAIPMTNFVTAKISVNDISINLDLSGTGLVPSCDLHITASTGHFDGNYELEPDPNDPTVIDVNQITNLTVTFDNFNTTYGGLCDVPLIGDIIQALFPDVEALTRDAIRDYLKDPDGAGPLDGPIANGIETALAGVTIAGPVGNALGVQFDAPLYAIPEDVNGITFGSDARFLVSIGTGPGKCLPPPGAPSLTASYAVNEGTPSFGTTTPINHTPYDVGVTLSTEAFNQLLRAQTECGLLVTSLSSLDLGNGPVPITASVLSLLIPQFAVFPPSTPFRIDVRPTLAPILAGRPGPSNELALLKLSQLIVTIVKNDASQAIALQGAVDAEVGLNLQFAAGGLGFLLSTPAASDVTIATLANPLGVNSVTLENTILPPLIAQLLPSVAGSLASFPLPTFLGLNLSGLEVTRSGEFMSLYTNLTPAP